MQPFYYEDEDKNSPIFAHHVHLFMCSPRFVYTGRLELYSFMWSQKIFDNFQFISIEQINVPITRSDKTRNRINDGRELAVAIQSGCNKPVNPAVSHKSCFHVCNL